MSITIQNLKLGYDASKPIISGLSTEFENGGIYGLLGLNGSGKTTLFRALSGMLKPLDGTIDVFGHIPFKKESGFLGKVMFVPINPVLPDLDGKEFVKIYSPFWHGFSADTLRYATDSLSVDMDRRLSSMSVGEQKKFMLSFALSVNTDVLMFDEPLAGLDMVAQNNLLKIIAGRQSSERILILSSNQAEEFDNILSHVAILYDGELLMNCPVEAIVSRLGFHDCGNHPNTIYEDGLNTISLNLDGEYTNIDLRTLFTGACSEESVRSVLRSINNEPKDE